MGPTPGILLWVTEAPLKTFFFFCFVLFFKLGQCFNEDQHFQKGTSCLRRARIKGLDIPTLLSGPKLASEFQLAS